MTNHFYASDFCDMDHGLRLGLGLSFMFSLFLPSLLHSRRV